MVRGPVRGRRRSAAPGRHPAGVERGFRSGARRGGRVRQRSRRVRRVRGGGRRSCEGAVPQRRLAARLRTRRRQLQPRRALGRRLAPVPAALRGRRHVASGAPGHGPADVGRRRDLRDDGKSLATAHGRPSRRRTTRRDPRALGRRGHSIATATGSWTDLPTGLSGWWSPKLVAGRIRAAAGQPGRGAAPPLPLRTRDGRARRSSIRSDRSQRLTCDRTGPSG